MGTPRPSPNVNRRLSLGAVGAMSMARRMSLGKRVGAGAANAAMTVRRGIISEIYYSRAGAASAAMTVRRERTGSRRSPLDHHCIYPRSPLSILFISLLQGGPIGKLTSILLMTDNAQLCHQLARIIMTALDCACAGTGSHE